MTQKWRFFTCRVRECEVQHLQSLAQADLIAEASAARATTHCCGESGVDLALRPVRIEHLAISRHQLVPCRVQLLLLLLLLRASCSCSAAAGSTGGGARVVTTVNAGRESLPLQHPADRLPLVRERFRPQAPRDWGKGQAVFRLDRLEQP